MLAVPVGYKVSDLSVDVSTKKLDTEDRLVLVYLFNELIAHATLTLVRFHAGIFHELMILTHWNDVD
jgi:hypothetical protein